MNFWFWFSLFGFVCMIVNSGMAAFESNMSGFLGWACAACSQFYYIATHFIIHAVK